MKERRYFFDKMNQVKHGEKAARIARRTRVEQFEFYAEWYHSAIRSLIDVYPSHSTDFAWIAKNVYPPITLKQVKHSIELLLGLGLIEADGKHGCRLTAKSITSGREMTSLAVQHFHRSTADLAKRAIEVLPVSKRNMSGLTLGISEETYRRICSEIEQFRSRIITLAEADDHADRTYQLNVHLFPVTRTDIAQKEGI